MPSEQAMQGSRLGAADMKPETAALFDPASDQAITAPSGADPYGLAIGGASPLAVAQAARPDNTRRTVSMVVLALIAAAVVPTLFFNGYHLFQLTMVVVYAIGILGLSLLIGFNGQIS